MGNKLLEFQLAIEKEELDAFFVTDLINVYYFTEFMSRSYVYILIYPDSKPVLFVPELEYEDAANSVKKAEVVKIKRDIEVLQVIKENLTERKVEKLGFEDKMVSLRLYKDISKKFPFVKLINGSNLIDEFRMSKTKREIEKIQEACRIADRGMGVALQSIEEGRTERDIAIEAEYEMRKAGSAGVPFETIIASGYRSALPHAITSDKKIEKGDFIIIDLGASYEGYCSDMTRTVVYGKPTSKQVKIFDAVLGAQQISIDSCKIGKGAAELDKIARDYLAKQGYEEFFVHALGHGVGLEVHELPYIGLKSKDVFKERCVFTLEPGVYIPEFGGVRIEDDALLIKDKVELLTKTDYEIER
ncbi:MAG: M24 family metallopeptidase [Candidatus Helarchaeota archaeon]